MLLPHFKYSPTIGPLSGSAHLNTMAVLCIFRTTSVALCTPSIQTSALWFSYLIHVPSVVLFCYLTAPFSHHSTLSYTEASGFTSLLLHDEKLCRM